MKSFTFLLFATLSFQSFAQSINYFEDNQEWQLNSSFWNGSDPCGTNTAYTYFIEGDTIIDNIVYKKLKRKFHVTEFYMSGQQGECDNETTGEENYRFVRQSGDSIFWRDPYQQGQDSLMISYNLNVGDTITNTSLVLGTNVVEKIDSINLNGNFHLIFYTDTVENNYVIEGVGHLTQNNSHGELVEWWTQGLEYETDLLCYSQNGTTVWVNPTYTGNCNYLNDLKVKTLSLEEPKLIKVVDLLGREVENKKDQILIYIYSDGSSLKVYND